jgi:hypothetical protein
MADGSQEQDGQADEQGEAREGSRGVDLGPDQLKAEASTLGVADLLLDRHAPIIERRDPS